MPLVYRYFGYCITPHIGNERDTAAITYCDRDSPFEGVEGAGGEARAKRSDTTRAERSNTTCAERSVTVRAERSATAHQSYGMHPLQ
jgi:hypothetical protein